MEVSAEAGRLGPPRVRKCLRRMLGVRASDVARRKGPIGRAGKMILLGAWRVARITGRVGAEGRLSPVPVRGRATC